MALLFGGAYYLESAYKLTDKWSVLSQGNNNDNQMTIQNAEPNLQKDDIVVGTGEEARVGDTVTVDYMGTLTDGKKFDSSKDHGQPFSFTLGEGSVIKGWEEGVPGMKVGGKRTLVIPPDLAYGNNAAGPIPANSTLIFEIELLKVTKPSLNILPGAKAGQ